MVRANVMGRKPLGRGSTETREALLKRGQELLSSGAIEGLRRTLRVEEATREIVARQWFYRTYFDDLDDYIEEVVKAMSDLARGEFRSVMASVMENYRNSSPEGREKSYLALLKFNFEMQFTQSAVPAGWVAQAAAAAYSEAFSGPRLPRTTSETSNRRLAEALLRERRAAYSEMTEILSGMVALALKEAGRRPKPGFTLEQITMLMHGLHDGMVLRRFLDPTDPPTERVAEAIYQLAWALTVPGAISTIDPREPSGPDRLAAFNSLVQECIRSASHGLSVSVETVAERAGVDRAEAASLFPSIGDLLDSSLRSLISAEGFAIGSVGQTFAIGILNTSLIMLAETVDATGDLFRAAFSQRPTTAFPSVLDELETMIASALENAEDAECANPRFTAQKLVQLLIQGTSAVEAIDSVLQVSTARP